jgi:hypothetical protein
MALSNFNKMSKKGKTMKISAVDKALASIPFHIHGLLAMEIYDPLTQFFCSVSVNGSFYGAYVIQAHGSIDCLVKVRTILFDEYNLCDNCILSSNMIVAPFIDPILPEFIGIRLIKDNLAEVVGACEGIRFNQKTRDYVVTERLEHTIH